ncbi:MAG: hypothetical protein OEQ12_06090 [Nitrosopumilus sp.]|nr:hypothetical protein [Nitrosopumilus sp.]
MNQQVFEKPTKDEYFWSAATKYAATAKNDEKFVSEIAYMMVTLHRTGA